MSGGICPRGYLSRGVSVQGVSGICPGVSVRGVHVPGGGGGCYVLELCTLVVDFICFRCFVEEALYSL